MKRPRRTQILIPLALCGLLTAVTAVGMGGVTLGATARSVDATSLPIGDGKVTTAGPRRGNVYSCGGGPGGGPPGGGGAQAEGPWIDDDGSYDLTAKATVDGRVHWRNAKLRKAKTQRRRIYSGNGLPKGATTGEFPIRASDDAYSYDRNPNSIRAQGVRYSLPRNARRAPRPSCLPMGPIGVAENGVAIFNALDALDRDAVAHEVQDSCGGHPQMSGLYHYHAIPSCLTKGESKRRASGLVGYALDGYPIFGPRGHGGKLLTNDDLDACHGRRSKVFYEGRWRRIYHYNATLEYPYTLGCFRGSLGT
ncbi:MAG TPA: YHYH protein [Solirubrobacterales bacterium]|jgi:hypothetical protein